MDVQYEIREILVRAGFLEPNAAARLSPLAGGVSSDVFRLDLPEGPVCVKRALPALRVAADWRAPAERSHVEVEWLRAARPVVGAAVPDVLFEARGDHLFVMTWFDPATHSVWKSDLAAGRTDPAFAAAVGATVAKVQAAAAGSAELAHRFDTTQMFEALRLAPFLRHVASVHADLAPRLTALADRTAAARISLVHGDVSPKNILHGPDRPVILDAECAWYGDPAFDLAFCSAHLLLKGVWKPAHRDGFFADLAAFRDAYLAGVTWEPAKALDARAAELMAAVLLARVDGKSPADYLRTEADKAFVRATARALLAGTPSSTAELAAAWRTRLESA